MQTFTVPRIDVLINDQLTNAVRGAFNSIGAAQLNSVLQSLAKKMTDALALANMNASESKAYGLLSRIPITASNLVVEACAALISGKDAAGNPLTGALANAASVFEAMTQVTASSMADIISLAASPPEQITNSRIKSLANIVRTGATLTAEVVGILGKIVGGEVSESEDVKAHNLQSVFSHGLGLSASGSDRIVAILNGQSTDRFTKAAVDQLVSIPVAPEATAVIAALLQAPTVTDGQDVVGAFSVLPVAASIKTNNLTYILNRILSGVSGSSSTDAQSRASGALAFMLFRRSN